MRGPPDGVTDVTDLRRDLEALRLDDDQAPSRWKWIVLLVALAIVASGFALWRSQAGATVVDVETVQARVEQPAVGGPGAPMLTASGYVVARRRAVVSAKIQGRLQDLRVEEGSRVREGELIARLESADHEAQVARAKARVTSVESSIARSRAAIARAEADLAEAVRLRRQAERLADERVVAQDTLEAARSREAVADAALAQTRAELGQAEAELSQARADVALYEALYQNTLIRAPFTGTVVRKMAEVGESVAPIPPGVNISTASGAIVALADLDTLEVEVDVSESNVGRLGDEQPAEVVVEAFPDRRYRAVLRQVIPTADRTRATVMVKVTILDKDALLKPEMSARVTFLERPSREGERKTMASAPERPVVYVPQQAVVTRNGTTQVFEVIDGGRVRVRPVVVGIVQRDQVVVKDGLVGTESLVARPPDTLKDGDVVRVRPGSR